MCRKQSRVARLGSAITLAVVVVAQACDDKAESNVGKGASALSASQATSGSTDSPVELRIVGTAFNVDCVTHRLAVAFQRERIAAVPFGLPEASSNARAVISVEADNQGTYVATLLVDTITEAGAMRDLAKVNMKVEGKDLTEREARRLAARVARSPAFRDFAETERLNGRAFKLTPALRVRSVAACSRSPVPGDASLGALP